VISVVVPAFQAADFVGEAVASARASGVDGLQIVVVDDGSTDGTADVVAGLAGDDLVLIEQANAGPAAARNTGVAAATGDLLAFLDADDAWPSGALRRQLATLDADGDADGAHGMTQFFGNLDGVQVRFDRPDEHVVRGAFLGSLLVRRRAFDRVGPFDESLRTGEDYDWFLRAREAGLRLVTTDEVALRYRVHPGGLSRDGEAGNRNLAVALHRSLQRRRGVRPGTTSGG
jgi:glycosyltransferase involved in cell wall biosynthesis